ncbi:MAG: DUF2652 domain-containing protein [Ferruginibacter sp.]
MAETDATILIPDISGFTEFMTSTELGHSSRAINKLIDAILKAVGDEYEVSEIEGDAVLLIKKGLPPSKKEIHNICIKIFNAFHYERVWLQQYTLCPCKACQAIKNLTLKFVVHHGRLAEITMGRFVKQSGPEMIVAHRLLKNSIENNEYLLMTEKLFQADDSESNEIEWTNAWEEYASIGKVDYRFTLLNEARKNVPAPPQQQIYHTDDTPYLEIPIDVNFHEVYVTIMNIPDRAQWMPGLQKVEQEINDVFVGSTHHLTFSDYTATISPLVMISEKDKIIYAESCEITEPDSSIVNEYIFKSTGKNSCALQVRFMNASSNPMPEKIKLALTERMQLMLQGLKLYLEKNTF